MSAGFGFKRDFTISKKGIEIEGKTNPTLGELKRLVREGIHGQENTVLVAVDVGNFRNPREVTKAMSITFSGNGMVEVDGKQVNTTEELMSNMDGLSFSYRRPRGIQESAAGRLKNLARKHS